MASSTQRTKNDHQPLSALEGVGRVDRHARGGEPLSQTVTVGAVRRDDDDVVGSQRQAGAEEASDQPGGNLVLGWIAPRLRRGVDKGLRTLAISLALIRLVLKQLLACPHGSAGNVIGTILHLQKG